MSLEISDRDRRLVAAIQEFFKDQTKYEPRKKLQPVRLSDPGSRAELMKIMDRIRAKNLFNFCEIIRRHQK